MANENNEIGDIVKKCKILLLDIEGTTTSINFVKDKLFPYAEENVKQFLDSQWETDDVKEAVAALRKLALEDAENKLDGVVSIPGEDASKEDQIDGLVNSVKWQMATDRKVGALKTIQGLIWKQGYDSGDLKGHVYEDVSPALQQWRSVEDHKVYIYSSGSVKAQKLLFGQSVVGDLLPHIDGHFDTAVGAKQELASYKAIVESIGCKPEEILFLTDILKEAEAARGAGLHVALVSREGNAPLSSEATSAYPLLHSLAQLTVSYKRKTDPQDEQPAKVLKTDADKDVKSNSEFQVIDAEKELVITEKKTAETEKMEVETIEESAKENKAEQAPVSVETIVEDITESSEVVDTTNSNTEPIVTEEIEENSKPTEVIDSIIDNVKAQKKTQDKIGDKDKTSGAKTTEEVKATIITEIEELSNDKQSLEEVGEIIEDLEPMVEEPVADEDMEELRNVGEVLEKECNEILSKVQDVTNLATITVKPLLNPIIEETMETETADSNDIVDKILDTELEMEMKQNEHMLETVPETVKIDEPKVEEEIPEKIINEDSISKTNQEEILKEHNFGKKETSLDKMEVIRPADVIGEENAALNKETEVVINKVQETNKELPNETNAESVSIQITNEKSESAIVKEVSSNKIKESVAKEEVANAKVDESTLVEGSKVLQDPPKAVELLTNGKLPEDLSMEPISKLIEPSVVPTEEMTEESVKQSSPMEESTKKLDSSSPMEESTDKTEESCKIEKKEDKEDIDNNAVIEATNVSADTKVPNDDIVERNKLPQVDEAVVEGNKSSPQEQNTSENVTETSNMETNVEENQMDVKPEKSETESKILSESNVCEEKRPEPHKEVQVNGKATTNGDSETVLNGDNRKVEEINSRLSSENGKEVVNGSNGEALETEQGKGDSKQEMDMTDIKVKTVSTDESHTDPVEQPTEA